MTRPVIGAIIVNWNSFGTLNTCLKAIFEQDVTFSKVVIIDNGQEKPPPDYFKFCPEYVRYIRLPENAGFAKANNIGLRELGDCRWIALINPDAFLDSDWLKQMRDAVHRHTDFSCFASRLLMTRRTDLLDGMGDVYHVSGLIWRDGHGEKINNRSMREREVFSPCAAAALYRRDALMAVGGFDEAFFCYVEDVDLGFRLRLGGHRCMYIPQAIAYHVGSATTGGSHSDFAVYHGHRNLVWAFFKNMPGILLLFLMPLHMFLNVASILWFALQGKGRIIIKAKKDALAGLPLLWQKRRYVQANRVASASDIWKVLDKRIFPGANRIRRFKILTR